MVTQPCADWPLEPGCTHGIPVDPAERTPEQVAALAAASEVLWRLTAGVFGLCPITVRPCRGGCPSVGMDSFPPRGIPPDGARWGAPTGMPALIGGQWLNIPCGCGRSACGCGPVSEIRLPGPVNAVTSVVINGDVLDPAAYRVDDLAMLVRVDAGWWPVCQDMGAPAGDPNTWSVTYEQGNPVPAGGRLAVGALAAELVNACTSKPCKLPANAVTVAREGVTIAIDTTGLLDAGRTGVAQVDMWLAAVNPNGRRYRSAVYSPDIPTYRETTWPVGVAPGP